MPRKKKIATAVALILTSSHALAENAHEGIYEEVVVTAAFETSVAETSTPVLVLSGEELREKAANSLGETLREEIGMANASFGPSLGHPVIRGQSGNRVQILQNGVGVTDASALSPDHAEGVEAILADRIEVIRGPATLLYGSGAVGGVVNVIDSRVPESVPEEIGFALEQNHNTNGEENKTVFRLDGGSGQFAFHVDGYRRDNDNIEIPGFALDEASIEMLEEMRHSDEDHDDEDHDDDHDDDHEEEELENTNGFVGNSDSEADAFSAGFSFVGDNGFAGFAVSRMTSDYGLPPGTHSHDHGHGDEEHGDEDHDDEDHDDEDHDDEDHDEDGHGEEEEVENVRIAMEKTRYDFRGGMNFDDSMIESVRFSLAYTDYEHNEIEIFEDGEREIGTIYTNEGIESRFTLNRASTGAWTGTYGVQFNDTEFAAVGEEAFIVPADVNNIGVFGIERYSGADFTVELGARVERAEVDPGACATSETAFSASGSVIYDVTPESNLLFGLSRSERAPSVEELFSNVDTGTCARQADDEDLVLHAATALLEIGNPNLDAETANNVELGYRYYGDRLQGEINVYRNQVDDYIYRNVDGEFEEQLLATYESRDATFTGLEAKLSAELYQSGSMAVIGGVFGDLVNADFDVGGNVPRIPPAKFGAELELSGSAWTVHAHVTRFADQDDVAAVELPTDGYTMAVLYADYHFNLGNQAKLKLFARGSNLLDEEIRNHTSFLRDYAPEPGRNITLGIRLDY